MTDKELMEKLHSMLANTLLSRISEHDVKASDLNVCRQFLKDNGIEALATEGSPLADLVATLPDFNDEDADVSEMKMN